MSGRGNGARWLALVALLALPLATLGAARAETETPTDVPNPTDTPSEPPTVTATDTPTVTPTHTPSATPTATATATDSRTPTSTPTLTASPTATQAATPTSAASATITRTPTRTATGTVTGTVTSTGTRTRTSTATQTATRTITATLTRTVTSTPIPTRTPTRTGTPTRTTTGTRTATGTRTETPTVTSTPTSTDTPTATPTLTFTSTATPSVTPTPAPTFVSVGLLEDRRGDNNDGTFTTIVSALVTNQNGNPVEDGTVAVFRLDPPQLGVAITREGRTNELPSCNYDSYERDTGRPLVPDAGTALACLRYVAGAENQSVNVVVTVEAGNETLRGMRSIRLPGPPPETPTFTQTPTATATGTATETPSEPIRLAVVAGAAKPGSAADVVVEFVDKPAAVFSASFDLLLQEAVFNLSAIETKCLKDPRLGRHELTVSVAFDPVPAGLRRFRFVFTPSGGPPVALGEGLLVRCTLPTDGDAPFGSSPLVLDRVLPADVEGEPVRNVLVVNGALAVDRNAPDPTDTPTVTPTPTATHTPTITPSRTPTVTPTRTPTRSPSATPSPTATRTPTPISCVGDCDGDGKVRVGELVLGVNVASSLAPLADCPNADGSQNGTVTIDELVSAVGSGLSGCPH